MIFDLFTPPECISSQNVRRSNKSDDVEGTGQYLVSRSKVNSVLSCNASPKPLVLDCIDS